MNKDLIKIRQIEEIKYYPLLIEAINSSPIKAKKPNELKRKDEELKLIHLGLNSKRIYYFYLLCKEAIKRGQPFIIDGNLGGLYILYLLEMVKLNPIETSCNYELVLGTDSTNLGIPYLNITVAESFKDTMTRIVENFDKDSQIYRETYDKDASYIINNEKFILLPKKIDINKYFKVMYNPYDFYKSIYSEDVEGLAIDIAVYGNKDLELLNKLRKKYGLVNSKDGIKDLFYMLDNSYIEGLSFKPEDDFFLTEDVKESLNDIISLYCFSQSSFVSILNKDLLMFSDRDSIFDYLHKTLGIDRKVSLKIAEEVRKGKFKNKNFKINPEVAKSFENILYLWPRGNMAEHVYYYLQLAQYKKKHPLDFLKYLTKLNSR